MLDVTYSLPDEVKQNAFRLADIVDLDEVEAARRLILDQESALSIGLPPLEFSINQLREDQYFTLDTLRLVLHLSIPDEARDDQALLNSRFGDLTSRIVEISKTQAEKHITFFQRCLDAMAGLRSSVYQNQERAQRASVLGPSTEEFGMNSLSQQTSDLLAQHEVLGCILVALARLNRGTLDDLQALWKVLQSFEKYESTLLHHMPATFELCIRLAAYNSEQTRRTIDQINDNLFDEQYKTKWPLHYVRAAIQLVWTSSYATWVYEDAPDGDDLDGRVERSAKLLADRFNESLTEHSFDFLLAMVADVQDPAWPDHARTGLRRWLQRQPGPTNGEMTPVSEAFRNVVAGEVEQIVDSIISNLPDDLRGLRTDEEQHRHLRIPEDHQYDLERFMLTITYSYSNRPESALQFWSDSEGNLYGFLLWAAKRQLTSIASLFCEMLVSLSQSEPCATAAYKLLEEDKSQSMGRIQYSQLMSWTIIFSEITYYMKKTHGRAITLPISKSYNADPAREEPPEIEEEAAVMLQSYLRLIAQVVRYSPEARSMMLSSTDYNAIDSIWSFCSKSLPSRLRACAFNTLEAFLQDKSQHDHEQFWQALGVWLTEGGSVGPADARNPTNSLPTSTAEEMAFTQTGDNFEEASAFLCFLQALIAPVSPPDQLRDRLPFFDQYSPSASQKGIDQLVDFAMNRVFVKLSEELSDRTERQLLRLTCFNFISLCLQSFNDHLLLLADSYDGAIDKCLSAQSLDHYLALHPFHKVMSWLFNDQVLSVLFAASHEDAEQVSNCSSTSPTVLSLTRCLETMLLIMENQKTYMTQVRRSVEQSGIKARYTPVANRTLTSFEESVLSHPELVVDLCLYCGSGHEEITLVSLRLLERLMTSVTYLTSKTPGPRQLRGVDQICELLRASGDALKIPQSLFLQLQATSGSALLEENSFPVLLRRAVLSLLDGGLDARDNRPSFTHMLLGLEDNQGILVFSDDSLNSRASLFREIVGIAIQTSAFDPSLGPTAEQMHICTASWQILRKLWRSTASSAVVLTELQIAEFWAACAANATPVNQATPWSGVVLGHPNFLILPSAECLRGFLAYRSLLFDYFSMEIRFLRSNGSLTDLDKASAALQGQCSPLTAPPFRCASILDMFDFMAMDLPLIPLQPESSTVSLRDLSACKDPQDATHRFYDLSLVRDFLELKERELQAKGLDPNSPEGNQISGELQGLEFFCLATNEAQRLQEARLSTLLNWQQLITSMLDILELTLPTKTSFIMKVLQLILPILDKLSTEGDQSEAIIVARLARAVIGHFDFRTLTSRGAGSGDIATHRLSKLFSTCIQGVYDPAAEIALRETLYTNCHLYLQGILELGEDGRLQQQEAVKVIKGSGMRLTEAICDDANTGAAAVMMPALLLLQDIIVISQTRDLRFFMLNLAKLGYPAILIESMRTIVDEAKSIPSEGKRAILQPPPPHASTC